MQMETLRAQTAARNFAQQYGIRIVGVSPRAMVEIDRREEAYSRLTHEQVRVSLEDSGENPDELILVVSERLNPDSDTAELPGVFRDAGIVTEDIFAAPEQYEVYVRSDRTAAA